MRVTVPARAGTYSWTSRTRSTLSGTVPRRDRRRQSVGVVVAHDAGARAADIGLDHQREADRVRPPSARSAARWTTRVRGDPEPEPGDQRQLPRLRAVDRDHVRPR